ncbi:unnamed protein product [Cochlearia groenlandica]
MRKKNTIPCVEVLSKDYFDLTTTDFKTTFDRAYSSDSSLEILSVTPSKENNERTKKVRNENVGKSNTHDPFSLADRNMVGWLDSWMKIDMFIFSIL